MLTYNAAAFIEDAIESVLMQEVDFVVQLVIGDDNSTDGTQAILRRYKASYPHLIDLHLHEVRGAGVPGRVNTINNLAHCNGRYVAMLDGNDKWLSESKLQRQVAFLEANPRYSSTSSDGIYDRYGKQYSKFYDQPHFPNTDFTFEQYASNGVSAILPSAWMFRREALLPLPDWYERVYVGDTYPMMLCLKSGPCFIMPSHDFYYRFHENSFGSTLMNSGYGSLKVHDDRDLMLTIFPELVATNPFQDEQIFRIICALKMAVVKTDVGLARESLKRFKWRNPKMYWYFVRVVYSYIKRKANILWAPRTQVAVGDVNPA